MNEGRGQNARRREAAVDWWMRLRAGPLGADEQAAYESWRADPANAAALDNIARLTAHMATLPRPAAKRPAPARPALRLALAAPLLAATVALLADWGELSAFLRSDHFSGAGETRLVTLEDGSRVHLDARSAIALRFDASERRVELLSGEAYFEVAPAPSRPFVVAAAGGSVTALGTAFDVALDETGAHVAVTEHSVRVASGGAEVTVGEGQQSAFRDGAVATAPAPVKTGWVTAWRRGKLIVENAPLRDLLAALGRRNRGVFACASAAICARGVTGVFSADDPAQAIEAIETALGLRATFVTRFVAILHE
ncbi:MULTISPECIES: FecR family protein [Methylosinus]|uniref:Iron dicitrate transport regulator FecR n=1 Tax=Methylosinus trichosporium (strain ATCC 35070 / NCIMB 11131 / UNIQEM 75 / OB3b) TaxID=595536 RepID=A0A2D2D2G5_METT3|nr:MULTISPECIES: FecR domain-containing protein [Methylosinus]ATQ69168.1 iron dicitrate transport regulator FecR [Methylosinus trichosporium OB3b]OBS53591.1 iron dicitrate transport regulator FecR [Methylosinus sp. 3S-1]